MQLPLDPSADKQPAPTTIVGSLNWPMPCTRPDIAFTVSMLSKFRSENLAAATYTLRYLQNTSDLAIQHDTKPYRTAWE